MAGGQQIGVEQGTLSEESELPLGGSESTLAAGDVVYSETIEEALTGEASSIASGTFGGANRVHRLQSRKVGGGSAARALSGVQLATALGTFTNSRAGLPTGIVVTGAQGAFVKQRARLLTGSAAAAAAGNVSIALRWTAQLVYSVQVDQDVTYDLPIVAAGGAYVDVQWVAPGGQPVWVQIIDGVVPKIRFTGQQTDSDDLSNVVLSATANGFTQNSNVNFSAGSITVNAASQPSGSLPTLTLAPAASGSYPYLATIYPAEGAVPSGYVVRSSTDTTLRSSTINTWPDGSARVVVLAGAAVQRSTTPTQITLTTLGTTPAETGEVRIGQLVSSVVVAYTGGADNIGTATVDSFTNGMKWWANEVFCCYRYRATFTNAPSMQAVVDIHAWAGSAHAFVEVTIENCLIDTGVSSVVTPTTKNYTASVTVTPKNGSPASIGSATAPNVGGGWWVGHEAFRSWYASCQVTGTVVSPVTHTPWGVEVTHDTASLWAHPVFSKPYTTAEDQSTYANEAYTPWSWSGWYEESAAGGVDLSLGPLSTCESNYIQNGDKRTRRAVIARGLAWLSYPYRYRASTGANTGKPPTPVDMGSKNGVAGTWPVVATKPGSQNYSGFDADHARSVGLVPFLCRPSPVFLENALSSALWAICKFGAYTTQDIGRARAWLTRNITYALSLTPLSWSNHQTAWQAHLEMYVSKFESDYTSDQNNRLQYYYDNDRLQIDNNSSWGPPGYSAGMQQPAWYHWYTHVEIHRADVTKVASASVRSRLTALADWMSHAAVRRVNEARGFSWRVNDYTETLATSESPPIAMPATWGAMRTWDLQNNPGGIFDALTPGFWLRQGGTYETYLPGYNDYFWASLVVSVERGISGSAAAWKTVNACLDTDPARKSAWVSSMSLNTVGSRWGIYPRNVPSVPYTLPTTPGTSLAITHADENWPWVDYPPRISAAEHIVSFGRNYGAGAFDVQFSKHGAWVAAGVGGHNASSLFGGVAFDFTTGKWEHHRVASGEPTYWEGINQAGVDFNNDGWGEVKNPPHNVGPYLPAPTHTELGNFAILGGRKVLHLWGYAADWNSNGGVSGSHVFDFDTNSWARKSTNLAPSGVGSYIQLLDPISRKIFMPRNDLSGNPNSGYGVDRLDTNSWSFGSDYWNTSGISYSSGWYGGFIMPYPIGGVRLMVLVNGGLTRLVGIRLDNNGVQSGQQAVELQRDPASVTFSTGSKGEWAFVPSQGCWYHMVGIPEYHAEGYNFTKDTYLYRIKPPSNPLTGQWLVSRHTITPSDSKPVPPRAVQAAKDNALAARYLIYVPALDCLAWFPLNEDYGISTDYTRVYLIKPPTVT